MNNLALAELLKGSGGGCNSKSLTTLLSRCWIHPWSVHVYASCDVMWCISWHVKCLLTWCIMWPGCAFWRTLTSWTYTHYLYSVWLWNMASNVICRSCVSLIFFLTTDLHITSRPEPDATRTATGSSWWWWCPQTTLIIRYTWQPDVGDCTAASQTAPNTPTPCSWFVREEYFQGTWSVQETPYHCAKVESSSSYIWVIPE